MKFAQTLLVPFVLLAGSVAAVAQQKSVIISYPKDTPQNIVDQARDAIVAAGGIITHEYKLIKGFACTASAKAFDTVNELTASFQPTIEEDQVISINNDA